MNPAIATNIHLSVRPTETLRFDAQLLETIVVLNARIGHASPYDTMLGMGLPVVAFYLRLDHDDPKGSAVEIVRAMDSLIEAAVRIRTQAIKRSVEEELELTPAP